MRIVSSEYVKRFRTITDSIGLRLPLPRINPSLVSALSVVTSLAFLLVLRRSPAIVSGALTLFGIVKHKHIILPLRAAFIVAFFFLELV